jgi:hypothetical protein
MRRPQKTMENRRKPFKSLKILKEKKNERDGIKGRPAARGARRTGATLTLP